MKYDIKNAFKALKDIEEEDVQQPTKFERKPLAEKYIKKPLKEAVTKLEPRFDSRKSFYGKARVDVKDDGTKVLWSYNTPVCRIKDGKVTLLRRRYLGWDSSQTTLRHVKDFLKQNGFEAGSYKEIAKMYPEEEASIDEGLTEDWKGPQIVEPGSKEYKNLQLACDILNQDSVNDISYKLEPTYFDYGQKWEYTAIIAYDPKGNIWGGSWQVGSPRNWEEIVNADSEEEVRAAIDDLKKGEYFRDVPADFPKHGPIKNYNLNELEHVEDWNGFAIYKVDDKYTINPNITRKRFDTIDELKKFLTKRYNIKEAVDGEEKLAFEWFTNELEVNKNLWDEENHAYDVDKVNELIDSQTEWDKDMLHWFFKQMGELDDTGYDYDSFVVLCGHYGKNESIEESFKPIKLKTTEGKDIFVVDDYGSGYQIATHDGFGNFNPWQKMNTKEVKIDGETYSFVTGYDTYNFDTVEDAIKFAEEKYGALSKVEEALKESTNIDLGNKEDLDKAREILDDNIEEETKEVIVDVDADSVEALKKSYAGQIILQCQKCFTPRFISAEELVKTEDKDEDGHSIYNIEDECSQCGEKAGYIVVGQVSKYDSEASKEAEEENGDVEGETPVDSIEPDMDILFDEEPEIEEESFNRIFTNYLTETYDNVVSFKLESGTFENREFVFEGVVEFKSGKTRNIKLVLEGKKVNNILMLESIDDNITYEHKSFVVEALIEGNKFTTKSLRYSYKAADQLVEGLIQ